MVVLPMVVVFVWKLKGVRGWCGGGVMGYGRLEIAVATWFQSCTRQRLLPGSCARADEGSMPHAGAFKRQPFAGGASLLRPSFNAPTRLYRGIVHRGAGASQHAVHGSLHHSVTRCNSARHNSAYPRPRRYQLK